MPQTNPGPGKQAPAPPTRECPHCRRSYYLPILRELIASEADEFRNFTCLSKGCGGLIHVGQAPQLKLTAVRPASNRLPQQSSGRHPRLESSAAQTITESREVDELSKTTHNGAGLSRTRQQEFDRLKTAIRDSVTRGQVYAERYKALKDVGEGSTAIVLSAEDLESNQVVALKFLVNTTFDDDEGAIARTRAERALRVQGMLNNPHVLRPLGSFVHESFGLTTVEKFVDGEPLIKVIEQNQWKRAITEMDARSIARQLGEVLRDAYDRKVVHRDIKPHNVMFVLRGNEPHVTLVDWGLARIRQTSGTADDMENPSGARNQWDVMVRIGLKGGKEKLSDSQVEDLSASLTSQNDILGTPHYMAPEHIKGAEADHRSDLYSLGATLYHLVTGEPPHRADNLVSLLKSALETECEMAWVVAERNGLRISKEFSRLLAKLLERDPEKRFQTAGEFVEALTSLPVAAPTTTRHRPVQAGWSSKDRWLIRLLSGFVLIVVIAVLLVHFWPTISGQLLR